MAIPVECPSCEHSFSVPDKYAGKKGKCPACDTVFETPDSTPKKRLPPLAPRRKTAKQEQPSTPPTTTPKIPLPRRVAETVTLNAAESTKVADAELVGEPPADPVPDISGPEVSTSATDEYPPPILHRARPSRAPLIAVILLLLIIAVTFAGLIAVLNPFGSGELASTEKENTTTTSTDEGKEGDSSTTSVTEKKEPDEKETAPVDIKETKLVEESELQRVWKMALPSICQVEVETPDGTKFESGFVIDNRGLIATNFSHVKSADSVRVRFAKGDSGKSWTTAKALGLAAFDPQRDLAILSVDITDLGSLPQLDLDVVHPTDPGEELIAVGFHEAGESAYAECKVKQLVASADVTPQTLLIERGLKAAKDLFFIETNAQVIPGVSGGPLLNKHGEVIGVNVRLSDSEGVGHAIQAKYLAAMIAGISDKITPFKRPMAATTEPVPVAKTTPSPMPAGVPPSKPALGSFDSEKVIKELHAQGKAMEWSPSTMEDYQKLQEFSEYLNAAQNTVDDESLDERIRGFLEVAVTEVLDDINTTSWPEYSKMVKTNELAAETLESSKAGFFTYVEVLFPADSTSEIDGHPAVVFKLIGVDTRVVLQVREAESARRLYKRSQWLLLGLRDMESEIEDGDGNRLPVINAKFLLGKPRRLPD